MTPFIFSLSSYIYLYSGAITLQYARPIINLKSSLVVNSSSGTELIHMWLDKIKWYKMLKKLGKIKITNYYIFIYFEYNLFLNILNSRRVYEEIFIFSSITFVSFRRIC